jgi:hypothetical protein
MAGKIKIGGRNMAMMLDALAQTGHAVLDETTRAAVDRVIGPAVEPARCPRGLCDGGSVAVESTDPTIPSEPCECKTPLKVYIAGGSSERLTVVRPIIDRLIKNHLNIHVVHDWTRNAEWDFVSVNAGELEANAARDVQVVASADVLWFIAPAEKSEGAATELGVALALKKKIIVSGPHAWRNIFGMLADESYDSHLGAFDALVNGDWR